MKNKSMMKWRLRRDSRCSSVDYEDIRRSLEVLDSVLAEYDDDTWPTPHAFINGIDSHFAAASDAQKEELQDEAETKWIPAINYSNSRGTDSNGYYSLDGSTSHISQFSNLEQAKATSPPPPPPKRSPTTKLSDRNSRHFTFPSDTTSMDSDDSVLSADAALSQPLHLPSLITRHFQSEISASPQDDEVFEMEPQINRSLDCDRHCVVCGAETKNRQPIMDSNQNDISSFMERCRRFDDGIEQHVSSAGTSPGSARKVHHVNDQSGSTSGSQFLLASRSQRQASFRTPPTSQKCNPSPKRSPRCSCEKRVQELNARFSEIRQLLRTKVIRILEIEPPAFKPSPPSLSQDEPSLEPACDGLSRDFDSNKSIRSGIWKSKQNLCDTCCRLVVSETIEDLPNLTPTDALNRPHLGLAYSMEDDLSPGIKEIQTSTPKSDASLRFSPRLPFKDPSSSCLSTFSHSATSLGYVSSQSELELNASPSNSSRDMVPVTSLKSQTLPIGMKLTPSPFYSNADHSHEKGYHSFTGDVNPTNRILRSVDVELRSSSAPPLPLKFENKKKHKRGFSIKEKKKNEDNLSVKSDLSLDEGIILKRIDALDGSTNLPDYTEQAEQPEEKPKRRSVWKSILRRK